MVYTPTTVAVAIACGVGGAYVNVTADVMDAEGSLSYQWGVADPLADPRPGQFTFTIADPTGVYAPDNPVTTLALPLTEGMGVTWQLNSRIVAGTIRSLETIFPAGAQASSVRVRVTCDDVLGDLARGGNNSRSLRQQYIDQSCVWAWSMDAPSGATVLFDTASGNAGIMTVRGARAAFGREPVGGVFSYANGVELNAAGTTGAVSFLTATASGMGSPFTGRVFSIDCRPTREPATPRTVMEIANTGLGSVRYLMGIPSAGTADMLSVAGTTFNMPLSMQLGQGYEIAVTLRPSVGTVSAEIYGDNGYYGYVDNGGAIAYPTVANYGINVGLDGCPIIVERVFARGGLSTGSSLPNNANFADKATTLVTRLGGVAGLGGVSGTSTQYVGSSADLSSRAAGQQTGGSSYLEAFADAIGIDGGRLYGACDTGSTLTAPLPVLMLVPGKSARATALTSAGTFSTNTDISGSPEIVRDTTNRYTQVVATSETASLIVKDPKASTLVVRSGNFFSPVYDPIELRAVASDYLRRARITGSRLRRITIDPRGTNGGVSRWADILALYPGARVRVSDLPAAQFVLGYWDGWFIGAEEVHTAQSNTFNIYLEPYLPPFVYDTARFAADVGELTLASSLTAGATTISVNTTNTLFTATSGEFPQKIIIDREVIQLNSAPVGTGPQVFSGVTRGVANTDGVTTTATTHASGAGVQIHPTTEFRL